MRIFFSEDLCLSLSSVVLLYKPITSYQTVSDNFAQLDQEIIVFTADKEIITFDHHQRLSQQTPLALVLCPQMNPFWS